jgi:O-antigen/teichoic acid export membrane protein
MSQGKRILKNATYLTVGDKLGYLIQFLFFLYFARTFGVVPTGEYSFGFTFAYACIVFADLGISVYLVREVARDYTKGRELFFDCLVLRAFFMVLVTILASVIIAVFFKDISPEKLNVIICWGIYWLLFSLADVFIAELNGHELMGQVALLGICLRTMSTLAGLLMIYLGFAYDAVLIVLPVTSFLYLLSCMAVSFYNLGPIRPRLKNMQYYKKLVLQLLPFCFSFVLVEIMWNQDILILGSMKNDESVGIYSSAIKIVSFILGMSPFLHVAMLPVLSRLFVESREKLIKIAVRILRYLIIASLPVSLGLGMISDKVIQLLYSDLFQDAGIVLKITAWMIAAGFMQAVFSVLLTAINRQKEKVVFIGIIFVITTTLNFILIHYLDFVGAAIVKLCTEVIGLLFFTYLVSKYLTSLPLIKLAVKPVLACVIMGGFIHYFYHLNLIYLIPASAVIYMTALLVMGVFTNEEIRFVKTLLPKKAL